MDDLRQTKRRLLGELGAEAKQWKGAALKEKYAPKPPPEEAPMEEGEAPSMEESGEEASEAEAADMDPVEEAKEALAKLDDAQVQALLATLK